LAPIVTAQDLHGFLADDCDQGLSSISADEMLDGVRDLTLYGRRRDARERSRPMGVAGQSRARYVIAITRRSLAGISRAHPVALIVVKLADQERMRVRLRIPPTNSLYVQALLDGLPVFQIDDRRVQSIVDLSLMAQSPDVDRVRQDPIEMAA
jgi:hypothetical protein